MFYVYELIDPRTGRVFYVGKGKGNRINHHETEARKGRLSRKCDLIRQIEADGLTIEKRKVKRFEIEDEAYEYEAELIEHYGLRNLTNVVPGGWGRASGPPRPPTPSLSEDRVCVRNLAMLHAWSRGLKFPILTMEYKGSSAAVDLGKLAEHYSEKMGGVFSRRGLKWMNDIGARFSVKFEPAEAQ